MERIKILPDYVTFTKEEKESALNCLEKNDTSIFVPGDLVKEFETKLADYLGSKHAIAVPNCTLALYATFQSLGINPDDEVIVPNLTHASSIYPILMSGAKIKVCDFIPGSYNYDLEMLESLITKKTKFMLVCYLYGMPLNIKEIKKICKDHNIILIEDAAQAFGTKVSNKYVGTYGDAGCYSFNDTKMLRIGEGGAVVTNDKKIHESIEHFRHVGEVFKANMESSVSSNSTYGDLLFNGLSNDGRGLNLRPSPITFSTGLKRIDFIDKIINERRKKFKRYYYELSNIKGINLIKNCNFNKLDQYAPIAYWIVLDKEMYDRNKVILGCINMGIPVGSFNYNTVIKNDYFKKFVKNKKDDLSDSQYIRDNSIFLPLYENITLEDVKKICKAFKYVIREYDKDNKDLFDEKVYDEEIVYFDGFYLMR